jgi:TolA-binding protein
MKDQSNNKCSLRIQSLQKQLGDKNRRIQQLNKLRIQQQNKQRIQKQTKVQAPDITDDMFMNLFSIMKMGG